MSSNVITILNGYEALVKAEKIVGFNISLQKDGLLVRCDDGSREEKIAVDTDTLSSLKVFFYGVDSIRHGSYDYVSLTSLINAKSILERMLHNNSPL